LSRSLCESRGRRFPTLRSSACFTAWRALLVPAGFLLLSAVLSAAPARAQIAQITDQGAGCGSFEASLSANGLVVAFESDCNPAGDNGDGSREIFLGGRTAEVVQVTDGSGCSSTAPAVSGDGARVAFESDCDLDGSNPDGNVEIWLWEGDEPVALTDTFGCTNLAPAIDGDGNRVVYDSDCVSVTDLSSEIVLVVSAGSGFGTKTQLTNDLSGLCDSLEPDIDASGTLVVFESDCDLVGDNEDLAPEIFASTSTGTITKLTAAPDDTCASFEASLSDDGAFVAFQSDCDFTGANSDGGSEIFQVQVDSGAVAQLSDDPSGVLCETASPAINGDGSGVAYASSCDETGANGDGSSEIFRVGGEVRQLTEAAGCTSLAPAVGSSGIEVVFDSDCDLAGSNGDGSTEIFDLFECNCGAPLSRRTVPRSSDALFVLRSAVGLVECLPCECDVDSNGRIVAGDALLTLKAAVGQNVSLVCPAP
jgi:Tol biopolymer transport system component